MVEYVGRLNFRYQTFRHLQLGQTLATVCLKVPYGVHIHETLVQFLPYWFLPFLKQLQIRLCSHFFFFNVMCWKCSQYTSQSLYLIHAYSVILSYAGPQSPTQRERLSKKEIYLCTVYRFLHSLAKLCHSTHIQRHMSEVYIRELSQCIPPTEQEADPEAVLCLSKVMRNGWMAFPTLFI